MKSNQSRIRRVAAVVIATCALGIGAAGSVPLASSATVVQAGSSGRNVFLPSSVTVSKGSKVTWRFSGLHNVKGKGWSSPFKSSGTWSHVFRTAGTFNYRCIIHPGMSGKVIVR